MRYYLLNKPRGCVTSTVDDTGRGRPTVYDVARAAGIPNFGPVGRLDFDTSGALLFTDDHKLKKAISSPYYKGKAKVGSVPSMEKVYHALVAGTISPDDKGVDQLREPLHFKRKHDGPEGMWTKPADVRVLVTKHFKQGQPVPWRFKPGTTASITWIELVLREGKNRQIRRLCHRSEYELTRLHRVSIGPIVLGDLKESCCRELTRAEVKALYNRCLPKDPLCPTVGEVKDTLKWRLEHTCWRICRAPSESTPGLQYGQREGIISQREGVISGQGNNTTGAQEAYARAGNSSVFMEGLPKILSTIIDFARRDLHETTREDLYCGEDIYFDEAHCLARARAVPPNEAHMVCGYRKSQIERLGI